MIKITPLYIKTVDEYKTRRRMMESRTRPKFNSPQRKAFHQAFKLASSNGIPDYYQLLFSRQTYEYSSPTARMAWNLWRQATDNQHHSSTQIIRDNMQLLHDNITLEMKILELETALTESRRKVPRTT